ncbi:MAG: rod shape-determining protein MreC [Victivallaceae bacterium]|nr:rod shape-determining protein MreC [Victivallaceae bacterium]
MKQTQNSNRLLWALGIFFGFLLLFAAFSLISGKSGRIAGRFFYPYLALEKFTGDRIADQSLLLFSREELAQKITALQERNQELAVRAFFAGNADAENRKLRKLWKLRESLQWRSVSAEIILRDPLFWRTQFTVDRGSEDGISCGDVVVTVRDDGTLLLVGVVHTVDRHSALVYTLYNGNFRFSFRLKNSGGIGFANTANRDPGAGLIGIEYLSGADNIATGEEMVTSGFEYRIPPNITIGTIRALNTVDPLYSVEKRHSGNAMPAAAIDEIHFVLILSRNEGTNL